MQRSARKRLLLNSFWLSILLHLLLLFFFIFFVSHQSVEEQEQHRTATEFVPSYVYSGAASPSIQQQRVSRTESKSETNENQKQEVTDAPKKTSKAIVTKPRNAVKRSSVLASTFHVLRQQQLSTLTAQVEKEPIYLIGDQNVSDPLIRLIGQALSANFHYPRTAGELGERGRVLVRFLLHPEGHVTDVQMVQSSGYQELDSAALFATNTAPKIVGADRFLTQPKHFTVCFIFS